MKKFLLFILAVITGVISSQTVVAEREVLVIAHRGASGYLPEHTISAYKLAIEQSADYIEPDLVMTRDGHLVARHDIYLSDSTDIASHPEFASRKRIFEGKEDWFVFDFTLAEIKTLRAIQPRPNRGQQFDGQETIPTIEEIIALVEDYKLRGKTVGMYVEMKSPAVFQSRDKNLELTLSDIFHDISTIGIPLYFQCFDGNFLMEMANVSDVRRILLGAGPIESLQPYIGQVTGFGLYKGAVLNNSGGSTGLVEQLHAYGSVVHVWTVRNDEVPKRFKNVEQELKALYSIGVDGIFADFPDTALSVRNNLNLVGPAETNDRFY